MNIILLTVLLTLLGAGLVVLLVWLGLSSWKSMRFRKDASLEFKNLEKRIDDLYSSISSRLDEYEKQVGDQFDDSYRTISREIEEVYKKVDEEKELKDRQLENLQRNVDSRFDKRDNALKEDLKSFEMNIETCLVRTHELREEVNKLKK